MYVAWWNLITNRGKRVSKFTCTQKFEDQRITCLWKEEWLDCSVTAVWKCGTVKYDHDQPRWKCLAHKGQSSWSKISANSNGSLPKKQSS